MIIKYKSPNRTFSHDVTFAILVFQTCPVGLLYQKIFIAAGHLYT